MAAENILDILTKVDRPRFTIDGESYEMRHPNELSMTDFHVLSTLGGSLVKYGDEYKDDPEAAFEAIRKCMDELLDLITPDLPKAARDKLNPFHVQRILTSFMGLYRIEPQPDASQHQDKPSPGSPDSTEADRRTG